MTQNADDVTLEGTAFFNSALSTTLLALPTDVGTVTILATEVSGDASLWIGFYDEFDALIAGEYENPLPNLTVGENTATFGDAPPAGAESFKVQLRLGNGDTATLSHLSMVTTPEPGAAMLMGLGLGLIAFFRRRSH